MRAQDELRREAVEIGATSESSERRETRGGFEPRERAHHALNRVHAQVQLGIRASGASLHVGARRELEAVEDCRRHHVRIELIVLDQAGGEGDAALGARADAAAGAATAAGGLAVALAALEELVATPDGSLEACACGRAARKDGADGLANVGGRVRRAEVGEERAVRVES